MADVGLDQLGTPELRVNLLGPFEVLPGRGNAPIRLPAGKATTVAQLLVVRRGSFVSSDAVVDALWGDDPPPGAAQNVASLVSRLRRALGAERIAGGRSGYRFETSGCSVDVDEGEALIAEADRQLRSGRPAVAASAAGRARLLLDRGGLLEEEPYAEWADDARRHAARLARAARRAAWTAALALGDHRAALDAASAAVDADPLDEEAHRARMHALHAGGDSAAALAAHEQLRRSLVEAVGADPGPETERLYLSILRSEPLPPPATRPGGTTVATASTGLVGRDDELAALARLWEGAVAGTPRTVVVCGPSGSGRTRLVAELARRAGAAGAAALSSACHPAERSLFLEPLIDALRSALATMPPDEVRAAAGPHAGTVAELVPDLAAVLGAPDYERSSPELEHRRALEAVAGVLGRLAARRPVLLVLDDLQNAGASTLEALHFVRGRLAAEPVLVAGTVTPEALDDVAASLGRPDEVIVLGPLPPEAVGELARLLGAPDVDAAVLHAETGGHVQFVVEALRLAAAGHAGRPESLRAAVLERVGRVGRDVEELLRVAAVVGNRFDLDFVAELAAVPVEDAARRAQAALQAHLLTTDDARFAFAGSIIRDVLLETTPVPIRASRHRRAAAMLPDRPEAAATHHAAAGEWDLAASAWSEAAERAIRAFAIRDAERLLAEAVAAAGRAGLPAAEARVRIRRGQLREELGDYAGAQDDHTAALTVARELADDTLEAMALERLGWTAYYGRDSAVASDLAARAAELAESAAAAPGALPSALVLVGRIRHWSGDLDEAAEAYEEALARDPDPATLASALSCLGALLEHGDRFADARRTLDLAAAEATRTGAFRPLLRTLFFAGLARANLGDFAGALRTLERKQRLLDRYGVSFYRARTSTVMSVVWRELGEVERARDLAEQALDQAREVAAGSLQVEQELHALLAGAECALLAGDTGRAGEMVDGAGALLSNWLPFRWRAELRWLDVRCRVTGEPADELLDLARGRRSRKYEALALGHLGRREEAATAALATGSDLLVAEVAPPAAALEAFDRLVAATPGELRHRFAGNGRLARLVAARR